jgi:hypothetical protein
MNKLYLPIDLTNFQEIQQQLLLLLPEDYLERKAPFAFNVEPARLAICAPELIQWIEQHSKIDVLHYRIYVTPAGTRLLPHIDGGGSKPIVPFRLNIPIIGTKGTRLVFFETPKDNLKTDIPDLYLSSTRPISMSDVKPIGSVEITTPHFVNTSVLHGVKNTTQNVRAMFVVTWLIDDVKYRNIEDVFNVD